MRTRPTVADVMIPDVVTVHEDMPFKQLACLLVIGQLGAVPVVDHEDRVLGVVSRSDLMHKVESRSCRRPRWGARRREVWRKAGATTAGSLMTSPAITIAGSSSLPDAASTMARHDIGRLVVMDGVRLVGIVTRTDLLGTFLRSDAQIQESVQRRILDGPLGSCHEVRASVHDGVVTLSGRLERQSTAVFLVQMTGVVTGVVDVVDHLGYRIADLDRMSLPRPPFG